MSGEAQRLTRHGTINGGATVINVDVTRIESGVPVKVQLLTSYSIERAFGLPSRPSLTGCSAGNLDFPRTIPSGTVIALFKGEADALVSAGAAS
jgi:hypothetical protein